MALTTLLKQYFLKATPHHWLQSIANKYYFTCSCLWQRRYFLVQ